MLFQQEKDQDLQVNEFNESFNGEVYICQTCNRSLAKKLIPCETVLNRNVCKFLPNVLKDFKKIREDIDSHENSFFKKKIVIMHRKCKFVKVKVIICNIPVDTENVCNILPRPIGSNGLIVVKPNRDLEYCRHAYFEPVQPASVYAALRYLKTENKF